MREFTIRVDDQGRIWFPEELYWLLRDRQSSPLLQTVSVEEQEPLDEAFLEQLTAEGILIPC